IIPLGVNIKLLLDDADVEYKYIKHTEESWPATKEKFIREGYYLESLPIFEVEGRRLGKTLPIIRYITKKL
ncbi:hypothetical protein DFQ28_001512, partial [Apophysomyces sp. BC1034]